MTDCLSYPVRQEQENPPFWTLFASPFTDKPHASEKSPKQTMKSCQSTRQTAIPFCILKQKEYNIMPVLNKEKQKTIRTENSRMSKEALPKKSLIQSFAEKTEINEEIIRITGMDFPVSPVQSYWRKELLTVF